MLSGGMYVVILGRIINLPRVQCLPKESLNILFIYFYLLTLIRRILPSSMLE